MSDALPRLRALRERTKDPQDPMWCSNKPILSLFDAELSAVIESLELEQRGRVQRAAQFVVNGLSNGHIEAMIDVLRVMQEERTADRGEASQSCENEWCIKVAGHEGVCKR